MSSVHQDERISKRPNPRNEDSERGNRAVTEDRENTDSLRLEERLSILRDVNTILPVPPPISGYHLMWLTTGQRDSIERHQRLGYELVLPSELPGFRISSQKSGTVSEDRIQINEMVLAKIPLELYRAYMKDMHTQATNQMEGMKSDTFNNVQDSRTRVMSSGYKGDDGRDGFEEFSRKPRTVNFATLQ